ncbi:ABC transporter substrate-binding protein [Corynebacterium pseudotuberculosis]|uniref:Transporter substrate-binding domain-containing protein n=1 Tax=Corynebacterium pseudotuberculosis 258 TaxID=1168865 RepID=A0AAU8Q6U1_CORPS|nr:ABC transporter substrate-binding protein [Corynebacterium pseudotuberculosis]AER68985.1 Serine/threonine-protein kinase PknD [Corynebacterium pseudotuberculosis 1/06-A]AEQ06485.1 transporter substrate-binding domain-containing protein [Corynebacterium pseudotuberculosis CIP 52.97]AFB72270.2 transporter substrate-binding domain-containing protein [Corynebacterium pseudotuberculosis 316]AFH90755.1 transporter substrate-binding domain-containing protein [Corynebacterium pseudotuberculosis 31]
MKSRTRVLALCTAITLAFSLSACVTNEEQGHPDGWEEVSPPAVPEIAALVPQPLAEKGTLVASANPPFAPFEFKNSHHEIIGMEMDLMRAASSVMGLKYQPIEQDFSLILPSLSAGTIDVGASGFTDNEERRKNYDFVDFLYAGVQWGKQVGSSVDPNNACGLSIAVQRTTVADTDIVRPLSDDCVAQGKKPIELLAYETSDQAATALVLGRADAFVADSPVLAWAISRAEGKLETVGSISDAAPYGFAVPKKSQLGVALAAAMQHLIKTGDYQRILKMWGINEGLVSSAMINEVPVT